MYLPQDCVLGKWSAYQHHIEFFLTMVSTLHERRKLVNCSENSKSLCEVYAVAERTDEANMDFEDYVRPK